MSISKHALLAAVLLVAAAAVTAQNQKGGAVTFIAPIVPSAAAPFRITMYGTNFSEGTQFRLTQNKTNCNVGALFAAGSRPPGTISNIVAWTKYDPKTFFVAQFLASQTGSQVRVCYSRDGGMKWFSARNNRGRLHMHVWRQVPTVTQIVPLTPTAGQPIFVRVPGLIKGSIGALTTRIDGCDGDVVQNSIRGANRSVYNLNSQTFAFTPSKSSATVYLCVATPPPLNDWSLIPYDPDSVVSSKAHPSQPLSGQLPLYFGRFAVEADTTRWRRGVLRCGAFVEGVPVTCRLTMVNKTTLTLAAADVSFASLRDGSGVEECPYPKVVQTRGSTTEVYFEWTPQRFGRGGQISLLYKSKPLFMRRTDFDRAWYIENSTAKGPYRVRRDESFQRLLVQPGFTQLHNYPYANLINFAYFGPASKWRFRKGVPGTVNGTTADELVTATMDDGQQSGSITKTTTIPTGSTMCQFNVKYYYSAEGGANYQVNALVGKVDVTIGATLFKSFSLYANGARVNVVGDGRRGSVVGDMRTWETIGVEIPVDSSYATITTTLNAYHSSVKKIYYSDVQLRCSAAVKTPKPEQLALQRIYSYVGTASTTLAKWRKSGAFFGDPCTDHWAGVTCRNMHVVTLDLTNGGLAGRFPQIPELIYLERLVLANNKLFGQVPSHFANLTRLQHIDLSNNGFNAVPAVLFTTTKHQCLQRILLRRNLLRRFPDQVQYLPKLQYLDMAYNSMVDSIPNWQPAVPLVHLDLSNNFLVGPLPDLPPQTIVTADFSVNKFNRTIPAQWSTLQRAEFLDVSKNQLTGSLPLELSKIRSAARLTFRAEENYFRGVMPNLGFRRVDVRDNIFKCPLPVKETFILTSAYGGMENMACDYAQI
jgi:Leucine-rich repeat (LRR) protein